MGSSQRAPANRDSTGRTNAARVRRRSCIGPDGPRTGPPRRPPRARGRRPFHYRARERTVPATRTCTFQADPLRLGHPSPRGRRRTLVLATVVAPAPRWHGREPRAAVLHSAALRRSHRTRAPGLLRQLAGECLGSRDRLRDRHPPGSGARWLHLAVRQTDRLPAPAFHCARAVGHRVRLPAGSTPESTSSDRCVRLSFHRRPATFHCQSAGTPASLRLTSAPCSSRDRVPDDTRHGSHAAAYRDLDRDPADLVWLRSLGRPWTGFLSCRAAPFLRSHKSCYIACRPVARTR